jgi:hypothetical protein
VKWAGGGASLVPSAQFHAYLRQTVEDFDAVEMMPHEPSLPRHYYLHEPVRGGDGAHLRKLVWRFSPASDLDRELIRSAFLTLFWGGAPGTRPAFLIEAADDDRQGGRGAGKTTFAAMLARLPGGHVDVRPDEKWPQLMPRLLSPAALGKRS